MRWLITDILQKEQAIIMSVAILWGLRLGWSRKTATSQPQNGVASPSKCLFFPNGYFPGILIANFAALAFLFPSIATPIITEYSKRADISLS